MCPWHQLWSVRQMKLASHASESSRSHTPCDGLNAVRFAVLYLNFYSERNQARELTAESFNSLVVETSFWPSKGDKPRQFKMCKTFFLWMGRLSDHMFFWGETTFNRECEWIAHWLPWNGKKYSLSLIMHFVNKWIFKSGVVLDFWLWLSLTTRTRGQERIFMYHMWFYYLFLTLDTRMQTECCRLVWNNKQRGRPLLSFDGIRRAGNIEKCIFMDGWLWFVIFVAFCLQRFFLL